MKFKREDCLPEELFHRRGTTVARDLIGKLLVNEENGAAGIIIETEVYLGAEDPSCHYDGKSTKRGKIFEKGPGTVYVYKIHGHDCMNFIAGTENYPEGVLIRALKPVEGVEEMKDRRGFDNEEKLCSGPGKLTEALGITKETHNGEKLEDSSLTVYDTDLSPEIDSGIRIGISSAEHWPMRFGMAGSDFLSENMERVETNFNSDRFYERADR